MQCTEAQSVQKRGLEFAVSNEDAQGEKFWPEFMAESWEPETFQVLEAALKPGQLVLDIGAWIGPITLFSAAKGCRVVSYEPDPAAFETLENNVSVNPQFQNQVSLKNLALAAASGKRRLFAIDAFGHSGASLNAFKGSTVSTEIECVDAYQELKQFDFSQVCLMKMDIEGAEFEVIPQIAPLLDQCQPTLYLSLHVKDDQTASGSDAVRKGFLRKWLNSVVRLKKYFTLANALSSYPCVYYYLDGRWQRRETLPVHNRKTFLRKQCFYKFNGSVLLSKTPLFPEAPSSR